MFVLRTRGDTGTEGEGRWYTQIGRLAFVVAQLMDVATTWYALKYTNATEGNPLMAGIADSAIAMLAVKTVGFILMQGMLYALVPPRWARRAWWGMALITFGVVFSNLIVIGG